MIPGISGKFDIKVKGKFVHTKSGGDGYLTEENKNKMLQKLRSIVEGSKK